jgi:hypothetical protein
MRIVYHAEHLIDAHLVKGLLEGEGIPAFVPGEFLVGGMGELPVLGVIAVAVPDSAWARARELILTEVERGALPVGTIEPDDPGLVPA